MAQKIMAIIGLGNPGQKYYLTRHNVGFRVLDTCAQRFQVSWKNYEIMDRACVTIDQRDVYFIKPQTFMNESGRIVPYLAGKGIRPEQVLVVHDDLELPFGKISWKLGGSARGHNGLKSLIASFGANFNRLRCGISRPDEAHEVPDYVLKPFSEEQSLVETMINRAADCVIQHLNNPEGGPSCA